MDTLINQLNISNYIFRQSFDSVSFQVDNLKPGDIIELEYKGVKNTIKGLCIKKKNNTITLLQNLNKYPCKQQINLNSSNIKKIVISKNIFMNKSNKKVRNSKFLDVNKLIKLI